MALLRHARPLRMSEDELVRISMPLDRVEADLPSVLDEHGIAVVTGVVGTDELAELEERWCRDLRHASSSEERRRYEGLGGGARDFPLELAERWTRGAGFVLERSLMHGEFGWSVRRHPNVHRAFAALYEEELEGELPRLVSSLDVPFFSPGSGPDSAVKGSESGATGVISAHVDQNPHDARRDLATREIFQGALYVWSAAGPDAAATVVWPGSHRASDDSGEPAPSSTLTDDPAAAMVGAYGCHYCAVTGMSDREARGKLVEGWKERARIVPVPVGGLLLWNSRTVHAGWKGSSNASRLAQAVCLEPVSRRPEMERIAKLRLCALGLPGTHWASVGMQHDMVLYGRGWLDSERGLGSEDESPPGLPVCVDWEKVKRLGGVARVREKLESLVFRGPGSDGFYLTGMWDHRKCEVEDLDTLLEELIKSEYQAYI